MWLYDHISHQDDGFGGAAAALDAARTATGDGVSIADVLAMHADQPRRVDLVLLGAVGLTSDRKQGSTSNVEKAP